MTFFYTGAETFRILEYLSMILNLTMPLFIPVKVAFNSFAMLISKMYFFCSIIQRVLRNWNWKIYFWLSVYIYLCLTNKFLLQHQNKHENGKTGEILMNYGNLPQNSFTWTASFLVTTHLANQRGAQQRQSTLGSTRLAGNVYKTGIWSPRQQWS
jgi:hypothetical protein